MCQDHMFNREYDEGDARSSTTLSNGGVGEDEEELRSIPLTMKDSSLSTSVVPSEHLAFRPYNKKLPILILMIFFVLLLSGAVLGWSSLLIPLREEGVYQWLCPEDSSSSSSSSSSSLSSSSAAEKVGCVEQELRYNAIFSLVILGICLFSLPVGWLLDRFGPRFLAIFASILVILSQLLIAFSSQSFDAYMLAFILFGIGGSGVYFAVIPLSGLFGAFIGTIMTLINVAFDCSLIVFAVWVSIRNSSDDNQTPSIRSFFLLYTIVPAAFALFSLTWPSKMTETCYLEKTKSSPSSSSSSSSSEKVLELSTSSSSPSPTWKDIFADMKTTRFALFFLWTCGSMLPLNHYLGAVAAEQIWVVNTHHSSSYSSSSESDSEKMVDFLTKSFTWIVSLSFVFAPPIGRVLDRTHPSTFLLITTIFGVISAVMRLIPAHPYFQLVVFLFYALWRMFFYATSTTFLIVTYGIEKFGRLWGCTVVVSGLICLLQYPFNHLAQVRFEGSYLELNFFFLLLSVVIFVFPIHQIRERRKRGGNDLFDSPSVAAVSASNSSGGEGRD